MMDDTLMAIVFVGVLIVIVAAVIRFESTH